ncbi:tRNA dimethylallyltransferase-like [Oratosquilla oratoria]|uniref:tRNA dimethylallyltransferase-like n=1 Tax=Oratosquilla oratoria TaxID=337810 RepID=UPI003F76C1B7
MMVEDQTCLPSFVTTLTRFGMLQLQSLQVWEQTGRKHSEILRTQQEEGGSKLGGGLRFSNVALLWIDCDQDVLDKRLDGRVDDMIQRGLLQELQDFHEKYNASRLAQNLEADYTKGIFQSIGFKEFHDYLILPRDQQDTHLGVEMYERGVEALKQVTRRYSRKQLKWIRNRIVARQDPKVYKVDGSDASRWDQFARFPAEEVVQAFLSGVPPALAPEPLPQHEFEAMYGVDRSDKTRFECEVCDRIVIGELQWTMHLKGNRHKKMLRRKARLEGKQD